MTGLSFATNQNNLLLQLKGLSSTEDYVNGGRKAKANGCPAARGPSPAGREQGLGPQHDRIISRTPRNNHYDHKM